MPQFEKWLQDNLTVVAGIFIGIALLQVRSSADSNVLSCWLSHQYLSDKRNKLVSPVLLSVLQLLIVLVSSGGEKPAMLLLFVLVDIWDLFSTESGERH